MRVGKLALALAFTLITGSSVWADEVLFNNGDRLSGKIVSVEGGKMTIDSKIGGTIKVDVTDVKTFTTDAPIEIRTKDGQRMTAKTTAGDTAGTVKVEGATGAAAGGAPRTVQVENMKYVNFSEAWTGDLVVGALFARGNTYADQVNISGDLGRRTEQDRWTFYGGLQFWPPARPGDGE